MRCYEIRDVLTEFIEGSLGAEQTREVVDHIARCKACERDVRQMESLIASLRALPPIEPPSRLQPTISDAVRGLTEQQSARVTPLRRRYMWLGGALGAAAAAAVFLGIVFGLRPDLIGIYGKQRVSVARLAEGEMDQGGQARERMMREAPPIEVESEKGLGEVAKGAEAAAGAPGGLQPQPGAALDLSPQPPTQPPAGATIAQRADALTELLRERAERPGAEAYEALGAAGERTVAPTQPVPVPGRPEAAAAARAREFDRMAAAEPGVAAARPSESVAPSPPSARAGGLWDEGRGARTDVRARVAAETEEGADVAAGARPGGYGGGVAVARAAPTASAESRMPFLRSGSDVQLGVQRAAPLRAGERGELIVTVHANRDVDDARVTIDVPKGVQLGGQYRDGVVFEGTLAKDTTKTIRVPVVPQDAGTKTFKAEATRGARGAPLAMAEAVIPVDAARPRGAPGAVGPAGSRGAVAPSTSDTHTLTFRDVDLHVALGQAAAEVGAKVQIGGAVPHTKITYSATRKPIGDIIRELAAQGGCQATLKDGVWQITPRSGGA